MDNLNHQQLSTWIFQNDANPHHEFLKGTTVEWLHNLIMKRIATHGLMDQHEGLLITREMISSEYTQLLNQEGDGFIAWVSDPKNRPISYYLKDKETKIEEDFWT